jgi:hypothetical protein
MFTRPGHAVIKDTQHTTERLQNASGRPTTGCTIQQRIIELQPHLYNLHSDVVQ